MGEVLLLSMEALSWYYGCERIKEDLPLAMGHTLLSDCWYSFGACIYCESYGWISKMVSQFK